MYEVLGKKSVQVNFFKYWGPMVEEFENRFFHKNFIVIFSRSPGRQVYNTQHTRLVYAMAIV